MIDDVNALLSEAKRVRDRAYEISRWTIRDNPMTASETLFDASQTIERLMAKVERLRILETAANATARDLAKQNDELEAALKIAHGGLRRALDYRAATPEGLAIKADIRKTLIESGDPGPWGVVGSG